jgi:2,3-bisphosphoglycerate-independent phosphoglycerate mutase
VPLLMKGGHTYVDGSDAFGETVCRAGALGRFPSRDLMPLALAAAGRLNKFGA